MGCVCVLSVCGAGVTFFFFFNFFLLDLILENNKHPGMFWLCGRMSAVVCVCMFLQARARWRHQARFVRSREEVIRRPRNRWVHLWTWWASPAGGAWADQLLQRPLRPSRPPTSQPPDPGAGTLCGARNVIFSDSFFSPHPSCCFTHPPNKNKKHTQKCSAVSYPSFTCQAWRTLHTLYFLVGERGPLSYFLWYCRVAAKTSGCITQYWMGNVSQKNSRNIIFLNSQSKRRGLINSSKFCIHSYMAHYIHLNTRGMTTGISGFQSVKQKYHLEFGFETLLAQHFAWILSFFRICRTANCLRWFHYWLV